MNYIWHLSTVALEQLFIFVLLLVEIEAVKHAMFMDSWRREATGSRREDREDRQDREDREDSEDSKDRQDRQ